MSTVNAAREAIAGSFSNWRLWLIQFLANPLLLVLFAAWLLIPVASVWQIGLNILLAILLITACVVLHAGTMKYFYDRYREEQVSLRIEFRRALRNLLPFLLWVAFFCLLWMLVDHLDNYRYTLPTYIRSTLSASMRRHIGYSLLVTTYAGFIFAARWIALPSMLLPFAISAANSGFRGFGGKGFRAWKSAVLSLSYWIILTLAALIGVFAAGELAIWTTDIRTSTYRHEMFSMVIRLFFSYSLALCAWMLACSVLGRQCGRVELVRDGAARDSCA
jgi:hypothetical protein